MYAGVTFFVDIVYKRLYFLGIYPYTYPDRSHTPNVCKLTASLRVSNKKNLANTKIIITYDLSPVSLYRQKKTTNLIS